MLYNVSPTGGLITLLNVASTSVKVTNVASAVVFHTHQCLEAYGLRFGQLWLFQRSKVTCINLVMPEYIWY